ncbi:MAG: chlorite dismutase family protein [Ferrovibrio sp.]|uniref:chlorite dismutase family protein n=1 Tax=Ferrovibrio sp. TaxID=1917215 RepID=UPI00391971BC
MPVDTIRAMLSPLHVTFIAGTSGPWRIDRINAVIGESLAAADALTVIEGNDPAADAGTAWMLRGFTSNTRYTTRLETASLTARQQGLGRPASTRAALIPIRKSEAWWTLAQDERREIFEAQSKHIEIGQEYLPGIARRLHHCRDLGGDFDFLTWFEFAPGDDSAFEMLLERLRQSPEWNYVEREVDIRLTRA